jgi:hypothetical protein
VGVEGGAVDGGGVGDVLDGDLLEVFGLQERGQRLLEELAGAADAGVESLTGGRIRGGCRGGLVEGAGDGIHREIVYLNLGWAVA